MTQETVILSVANKPIVLRVIMLSVAMLVVVMLNVVAPVIRSKVVSKLLLVTSPIVEYLRVKSWVPSVCFCLLVSVASTLV
jgi:hypothetical protein